MFFFKAAGQKNISKKWILIWNKLYTKLYGTKVKLNYFLPLLSKYPATKVIIVLLNTVLFFVESLHQRKKYAQHQKKCITWKVKPAPIQDRKMPDVNLHQISLLFVSWDQIHEESRNFEPKSDWEIQTWSMAYLQLIAIGKSMLI